MNPQDILGIISRVENSQNAQNTNSNPDFFNVACSIAGGILGGPAGMAIAGIAGTALSTIFNQNNSQRNANPQSMSRSRLSDIIENQMNDEQRRKLAQMVRQIMRENPNSNNRQPHSLENQNMSNTLISQVLNVAQNVGQNAVRPSNSNRFNYRQRLGSQSRPQSGGGCGGGCGCSRRSSSS